MSACRFHRVELVLSHLAVSCFAFGEENRRDDSFFKGDIFNQPGGEI